MSETAAANRNDLSLDVRELHLWRGDRHLLRGVSFALRSGQLLQIVGPNGAGKTSLLRCVSGLMPPEAGEIVWRGESIARTRDAYHQQLAYLAHANALKADLTAFENLHYGVGLRRSIAAAEIRDVAERLQIAACMDLPVRALSAGQKRRVALARILLTHAAFWILDEPITNLDSAGVSWVERCMAEHLAQGGMILAAAHQTLLQDHALASTLELH